VPACTPCQQHRTPPLHALCAHGFVDTTGCSEPHAATGISGPGWYATLRCCVAAPLAALHAMLLQPCSQADVWLYGTLLDHHKPVRTTQDILHPARLAASPAHADSMLASTCPMAVCGAMGRMYHTGQQYGGTAVRRHSCAAEPGHRCQCTSTAGCIWWQTSTRLDCQH
jgi:hypothetical protein